MHRARCLFECPDCEARPRILVEVDWQTTFTLACPVCGSQRLQSIGQGLAVDPLESMLGTTESLETAATLPAPVDAKPAPPGDFVQLGSRVPCGVFECGSVLLVQPEERMTTVLKREGWTRDADDAGPWRCTKHAAESVAAAP